MSDKSFVLHKKEKSPNTIWERLNRERRVPMKYANCLALTLVIIGAINWGLIGFFRFNLVSLIFGDMTWISRIIYGLVGLCGLYLISFYRFLNTEESS